MKRFLAILVLAYSCSSLPEEPQYYSTRVEQANALYQGEHYLEAHQIFDSLSRLDSTNAELFYCKAKCEYALRMNEDCDRNFKYSISLGHKVANAYHNLGQLHLFRNDSLALVYFNEYLKENPDDKWVTELVLDIKRRNRKDALLK